MDISWQHKCIGLTWFVLAAGLANYPEYHDEARHLLWQVVGREPDFIPAQKLLDQLTQDQGANGQ
jgi:hypothetical protein